MRFLDLNYQAALSDVTQKSKWYYDFVLVLQYSLLKQDRKHLAKRFAMQQCCIHVVNIKISTIRSSLSHFPRMLKHANTSDF